MLKQIAVRLGATFVAAAIPNILAGMLVDVEVWQAADMTGAVAVPGVVRLLAATYKTDSRHTLDEVEQAYKGKD